VAAVNAIIRWETPPPDRRAGTGIPVFDHEAIAAELRAHPRRWAVVFEGRYGMGGYATFIRTGRHAAYRPVGHFDAVRRYAAADDDVMIVYARYLGSLLEAAP
jgi:hypothetical protein